MKILQVCLVLLGYFLVGQSFAQIVNHEDVVKVKFSLEQNGCNAFIVADIQVVNGYHINSFLLPKDSYAIRSDIVIARQSGITIKGITETKPFVFEDELGDMQSYHKGKVKMKREITINSQKDLIVKGGFSFQVCDEAGKCLMPHTYPFQLSVKGCLSGTSVSDSLIENDSSILSTKSDNEVSLDNLNKSDKKEKVNNTNIESGKDESSKSLWLIFILFIFKWFRCFINSLCIPNDSNDC